jgi:NAD(P)-dependent dehydrogenase (short-subunit alcohol dehydrogenase family)
MADDDVLVITGGAGGMGLASACALAGRGRLLLVDADEGHLEAARSMLSARGASVETLLCDVTSPADVAAVAERVSAWGRFRCLVHTVSVSPRWPTPGQ